MHWLQFVDNDDNEFRSRTFGGATDAILDVGFSFGTDVVLDVGCSIGTGVVATDFSVTFETDVMVTYHGATCATRALWRVIATSFKHHHNSLSSVNVMKNTIRDGSSTASIMYYIHIVPPEFRRRWHTGRMRSKPRPEVELNLVDHPTQLICIWIFICWVGGGDPCGAVELWISGPCNQKKQARTHVFSKYPCHLYKDCLEGKKRDKKRS